MASKNGISQISFGNSFTSGISNAGKRIYNSIPNFNPINNEKVIGCIEKFGRKCTSD